jgi:hypothetical protein
MTEHLSEELVEMTEHLSEALVEIKSQEVMISLIS